MRRSIGLPLTIGIVLVLLALTLAVGWSILVVRGIGDVQQVAERLSNTHWVLLSLGSLNSRSKSARSKGSRGRSAPGARSEGRSRSPIRSR